MLPQARLLILLCEPVERVLSQVLHSQRLGLEPLPLEEAFFAAESEHLRNAGEAQTGGERHKCHQDIVMSRAAVTSCNLSVMRICSRLSSYGFDAVKTCLNDQNGCGGTCSSGLR